MSRIIIDVREPNEYASGHIIGALNIPPAILMAGSELLSGVSADAEIIVYCLSGSRSAVSINVLQAMGYNNVINGINKDQVASKYGLNIS